MTNEDITWKLMKERLAEAQERYPNEDIAGDYAYVLGQFSIMLATAVNYAVNESPEAAQRYLEGLLRESPQGRADQMVSLGWVAGKSL